LAGEIRKTVYLRASGHNFCIKFINKGLLVRFGSEWKSIWKASSLMDETNLEKKLKELVEEFGEMVDPQYKKLAMLAQQAKDSSKQLEKSVNSLQESLDYLRICIKYQLFDLEATRRENDYLRKILGGDDS
jgi:hypothetical protein